MFRKRSSIFGSVRAKEIDKEQANPELENQINKRKSEMIENRVKKTMEEHRSGSRKDMESEVKNLRSRLRRASSLGVEVIEDAESKQTFAENSRSIRRNAKIFTDSTKEICPHSFFDLDRLQAQGNLHSQETIKDISMAGKTFFENVFMPPSGMAITSRRAAMQARGNTEISDFPYIFLFRIFKM